MKEAWAKRGAALFQSRARRTAPATERDTGGARGQPAARNRQQAEGAARCAHVAGRASQTRAASYRTRWPRRQSRYRGPDRRRPRYDLQRAAVGAGRLKSHHGGEAGATCSRSLTVRRSPPCRMNRTSMPSGSAAGSISIIMSRSPSITTASLTTSCIRRSRLASPKKPSSAQLPLVQIGRRHPQERHRQNSSSHRGSAHPLPRQSWTILSSLQKTIKPMWGPKNISRAFLSASPEMLDNAVSDGKLFEIKTKKR